MPIKIIIIIENPFSFYLLFLLLGHETLSEYFVSTFLHLKWKIINPSTSIPPITATPTLELSASWVVIPINICAEEGCAFTENIIDSKVFARFVLRNDPGKMRSGECLNCPLEDCYEYSEEPEFPCFIQLQGEGSDSDITYDRYRDQICRAIFFRQFPNRIENGKATICVRSKARSRLLSSIPTSFP